MSARYPEEAKNFRLLGHDPSAAWGGGSLVQVTDGHAYVGAMAVRAFNGGTRFEYTQLGPHSRLSAAPSRSVASPSGTRHKPR